MTLTIYILKQAQLLDFPSVEGGEEKYGWEGRSLYGPVINHIHPKILISINGFKSNAYPVKNKHKQ
jgi:hypothetical protein